MSVCGDKWEEYSVIEDEGKVGFIDFDDDRSVCSYDPTAEGPIIISVPFPFVDQKPHSVSVDEVASASITIKNTTRESVEIWKIQIYASNPADSFKLSLMEPSRPEFVGSTTLEDRVLQPLKMLTVWLSCEPKDMGMHTCIVHFDVGDDRIERVVFLLAEDSVSKALASRKPYQRGRKQTNFVVDSYVKGVRPAGRANNHIFRNRLPIYEIPKEMREVIESKQVPDAIIEGLSRKNYVPFFRTLVMMEELRMEEDIKAYDMENVKMKRKGYQFVTLEVLGLAERRPSLVHGDSVYARLTQADDSQVYEGCIHRVEADQVYLRFADEFHKCHNDNNSYSIRFMYNRTNMRRLYQAIEAAEKLHKDFLFPTESSAKRQITPTIMVPISSNLNEEQLNAVEMILGCKGGVPYMINGPPGTGKTMTLVEVILQLYRSSKNSRILICASSNSAADHILDKIRKVENIKIRENEIFRLNASSRPVEDMSSDCMQFCFFEQSVFRCPPLKALLHYRIIISTYMSSALLYSEGVRQGHFSHIILDEAGQASEPETIVPISNFCQKNTVVVLAGDPMQLGPVIFSHDARKHGLGKSYLERLFECELYSEGDEGYVTTLRRNYRSHPEILELPSKLFYNRELIAVRETMKSTPWEDLLPNKDFPVLFTGIQAYDEREGDNPSWFNRTEASMVVKLINKLIGKGVEEMDIGVITPYKQQVTKIKKALDNYDIFDVKIGSVEQFQGQEREVIIISTVRSTVKHDQFDKAYCLGFLSNPKRFNVAITRAKSLLVIIGNPHIISKDLYWEKLLWRCVDNYSYEGCSLPERNTWCSDDAMDQQEFGNSSASYEGRSVAPERLQAVDGWSLDAVVQDLSLDDNGFPKPVVDEDAWSDGWKDDCQVLPWDNGAVSKPVNDEDGWSDGWKDNGGQKLSSDNANIYNPAVDEAEWSDGWKDNAEVLPWNNGAEVLEKPVIDDGWSDGWKDNGGQKLSSDNANIYNPAVDEAEWSDGWKDNAEVLPWNNGDISKPLNDEDGLSDGWNDSGNPKLSWDDGNIPEPVKDEDEWSDGWK